MTAATLDARLRDLPFQVIKLASLTTDAVSAGTDALIEGDLGAAQRVIDDDDAIDALRHTIEDNCLRLLASGIRDLPDVRFVAATLRSVHELERSADLMVNVAKTTWRLEGHPLDTASARLVERMGRQAALQLRVAVGAFVDRDRSCAAALADMDEALDELVQRLYQHILECAPGTNDASVVQAVQLGLVARHYERVGDHAVTIAEQVHLVVTGTRSFRARPRAALSR
jgi:phosphate transport system protein